MPSLKGAHLMSGQQHYWDGKMGLCRSKSNKNKINIDFREVNICLWPMRSSRRQLFQVIGFSYSLEALESRTVLHSIPLHFHHLSERIMDLGISGFKISNIPLQIQFIIVSKSRSLWCCHVLPFKHPKSSRSELSSFKAERFRYISITCILHNKQNIESRVTDLIEFMPNVLQLWTTRWNPSCLPVCILNEHWQYAQIVILTRS